MTGMSEIRLRGMTWDHARGIDPLLAASEEFRKSHPGVSLSWDSRPLHDFESVPLGELAREHDLIVIDYPHLGQAVRENLLLDFNTGARRPELLQIAAQSAGSSYQSYEMSQGQWALPIDAATAVASYRADLLEQVPGNWEELLQLAERRQLIMPMRAPHGFMAFLWLARNRRLPVATDAERLMRDEDIELILDQLRQLTCNLRADCFKMNPIAVYELMSTESRGPAYCPHGYGYINYAQDGFREHLLTFTDVPDAAGGGVSGTVLGGTGIAVSTLSKQMDAASEFALWIAGEHCQTRLWVENGGQPAHAAAWSDSECNRLCNDFLSNTRATLDAAWVRPRYSGYLGFQGLASHTLTDYLQGRLSMTHCVQALQRLYRKSRQPVRTAAPA